MSRCFTKLFELFEDELNADKNSRPIIEAKDLDMPHEIHISWSIYHMMANEFARHLSNEINELTLASHRLVLWERALEKLNDDKQAYFEAVFMFVKPQAVFALSAPYSIKEAIEFSIENLLKARAYRTRGEQVKKAKIETLLDSSAAEAAWNAAQKISSRSYHKSIRNFRHENNHAVPVNIILGQSHFSRMRKDEKGRDAGYSIGYQEPLQLSEMHEPLREELVRMHAAYHAFIAMISEHAKEIVATGIPK